MHRLRLRLYPADVLLFREPRPFEAGTTGLESLLPNPGTLAGAVRTWLLNGLGVDLGAFRQKVRRRRQDNPEGDADSIVTEVLRETTGGNPGHQWLSSLRLAGPLFYCCLPDQHLFPVPQHLVLKPDKGDLGYLMPLPDAPPWTLAPAGAPCTYRPCWLPSAQDFEAASGYLTQSLLHRALCGQEVAHGRLIRAEEVHQPEPRLGIGMDSRRNATEEGMLYALSFLRLVEPVEPGDGQIAGPRCLLVDLLTEEDVSPFVKAALRRQPWLPLGGERKVARVELEEDVSEDAAYPSPPVPAPAPPDDRFCTYLATPAFFGEPGWFPQALRQQFDLVGAVVGAPLVCSGWDGFVGRPKPARCAVRAGAVHFWKLKDGQTWHPDQDPHGRCISDSDEDRRAGWGLCFRGEWDYAK